MKRITKRMERALKIFGEEYSVKAIDLEWCAYRKIGDKHDVEISGINSKPYDEVSIYFWQLSPLTRIVATRHDVKLSNVTDVVDCFIEELNNGRVSKIES